MYGTRRHSPGPERDQDLAHDRGRRLAGFLLGMLIGAGVVAAGIGVGKSIPSPAQPPVASPAQAGDGSPLEAAQAGLRIDCRNDALCIKTSEGDWGDGDGPLSRRFLRLPVYNDGPEAATRCRVRLASLAEVTPGGTIPVNFEGPSPLLWSGESPARPEGRVVRSNANPEVADLLYTVHRPDGDRIYLKDERYRTILRFSRRYVFEVVVSADDGEERKKRIMVRFGPTWDDFEVLGD